MTMGSVRAADFITVYLDQAKVTKLPDRVATLVIGNPLIADVTLQRGGMIIITGKGYGITNLIALDAAGAVLREQSIEVRGPREDVVVVYRGVNRESYSCTPNCERRITLGDNPEYFAAALGEAGDRSSRAQGSAATSGR
jgi:Flp pilus assembly secretin CpaC